MKKRVTMMLVVFPALFDALEIGAALLAQETLVGLPAASAAASTESVQARAIRPADYGVGNTNILQIPAAAFSVFGNTAPWGVDTNGYLHPISGSFNAWAPVILPTGSRIFYLDLYYSDTDASANGYAFLAALTGFNNSADVDQLASVFTSGDTGKAYGASQPIFYDVNNDVRFGGGAQLIIQVHLPSPEVGFKAVDLWWTRQMSPAPGSATFADVPTSHPFFRAIEALVASGVTSGCGGGNYCPDSPVTRGEIAKFLVRALGMYWPD
jgi:hypothetical protein